MGVTQTSLDASQNLSNRPKMAERNLRKRTGKEGIESNGSSTTKKVKMTRPLDLPEWKDIPPVPGMPYALLYLDNDCC